MADKFEWDGEKIKRIREVEEVKVSPKDLIEGIDHTRVQIEQMKDGLEKLRLQKEKLNRDIQTAQDHLKNLLPFEHDCLELQKNHLIDAINSVKDGVKDAVIVEVGKEVEKDPFIDESQMARMQYHKFQHKLGTHEKVAKKVCARIIKKYVFEQPVFDNPFV